MNNSQQQHSKNSLRAWLQLLKTAKRIESRMNSHFVSVHGSSMSRFDVLANLARCENHTASTSELSAMLLASKGNITRLLDRMESDGLIQRANKPDDRRVSIVTMLPAGLRLFQSLAADHEHWIDDLFQPLSNSEISKLNRLMDKLRVRMDATNSEPRR